MKENIDIKHARDNFHRMNEFSSLSQMPFTMSDLLRFSLGDKLGQGVYRAVYMWNHNKGVVVKYADAVERNTLEWGVWEAVKGTHYQKWFAPVINCSPCGHFLLMKYARPITDKDKLPNKIPGFFTDLKKSNYGFIGNQLVCVDYHFISKAFDQAAMVTGPLKFWE